MVREKIDFTKLEDFDLAYAILNRDDKTGPFGKHGFLFVEETQTYFDPEKHYTNNDLIIKRISDGKFFKGEFSDWGCGEIEVSDYEFTEVLPITKTVVVYE